MSDIPTVHDTLRLAHEEAESILEELNDEIVSQAELTLRKHDRYTYNVKEGIVACFNNPHQGWTKYVVRPRNISSGGISVIHGFFVYPDTPCRVQVRRLDGDHEQATGLVVDCCCVKGRAHEVKIKFDNQLEIENFAVVEPPETAKDSDYHREPILLEIGHLTKAIRRHAPKAEIRDKLHFIESLLNRIPEEKETEPEKTSFKNLRYALIRKPED